VPGGHGIDIEPRRRAEKALREINSSLERRVEERTAELAVARDRAEAADRLKSAFLATMSHELRTPLNSIIGFTGILLQKLAGPLNAEQEKQLGMVRGSARHLLELINDVLDISKIEAGELEIRREPFNLRESVDRLMGLVKPMADRKGLALEKELPESLPIIASDRRRVEQILLNLLNNGIKFTEVGKVTLAAELLQAYRGPGATSAGPGVRLSVADTGIGIDPKDLPTLFRPFRQIDSGLSRRHEGTGLGLAICRRLAELLGGEVSAQSEPGRGSVFTVTLPVTENA
jgi:signal transduction histidine kinase